MTPEQAPPPSPAHPAVASRHCCTPLSWGAILAGTVAALALHIVFMMLGAGLGFAIYTPTTDANPVKDLAGGAMVIQGVSAVVSLWFGGWIAGRFTHRASRRSGCLHGFMVWSLATVAAILAISIGSGWAFGGLTNIVAGSLSFAGKPAAALAGSAADLVKDSAKRTGNSVGSFVDEAVNEHPSTSGQSGTIRARREIGLAVERLFAPYQQANMAANRAAAVKVLVDDAGMSEAEADKLVSDWTASYQNLKEHLTAAKNEAEAKAREAAEHASNILSIFSLCTFAAFLLGAVSASMGGKHGAECAAKHAGAPAGDVEI